MTWPFVVWLLAIAGAMFLFMHGGQFGGMSGVVDTVRERIAPIETARLDVLAVEVGQQVEAGDVVARMDTAILDSELVLEKLQSERRFASEVTGIRSDIQDMRRRQVEDKAELEVLREEIERMEPLVAEQLVSAEDLVDIRARARALEAAVKLYPELLTELRQELAAAETRMNSMEDNLSTSEGGADAETRTGLLRLRRRNYVLRARSAGIVADIGYDPGEVVPAGDTVVTVLVTETAQVVAYLPEANAGEVAVGDDVYLSSATRGGRIVPGHVTAIVPEIMAMPNQVNPFINRAFRGRRVIIKADDQDYFLPGESLKVQLGRPLISRLFDFLLGRDDQADAAKS